LNACGSGSFLLSAILENRKYIGIEKNEDVLLHKVQPIDYIQVCNDRITEVKQGFHKKQTVLNPTFDFWEESFEKAGSL
jgi:site-specific DNA-methyltransferase (adenine-specific)/modification methylase